MKIIIRVDGYQKIGLGHLVRCLAIADKLLERDISTKIVFLSKLDDFSKKLIKDRNFKIINLKNYEKEEDYVLRIVNKENADILFIDNIYDYEPDYIKKLRNKIQVIIFHYYRPACFYADKYILPSAHSEDSIVDHILWSKSEVKFFNSADFIIINQEIQEIKEKRQKKKVEHDRLKIVVTTGGSDPAGVLLKILNWLSDRTFSNLDICVLKGQAFMHSLNLELLIPKLASNIRVVPYNSNELIDADIAVSTFGVSTYELMYLGIPILSIGHAEPNARGSYLIEKRYKALIDLGIIDKLSKHGFVESLKSVINSSELRNNLVKRGNKIVDGKGLDRVVDAIYL